MQVDTRQPNPADPGHNFGESMKRLCWLWPLWLFVTAAFAQSFVTLYGVVDVSVEREG